MSSRPPFEGIIQQAQVTRYHLKDDGTIPNNDRLPLLVYQHALDLSTGDPAATCEAIFAANGWVGSWRNGIFSYHHYHSNAHEVLAIAQGRASVQFGGETGAVFSVGPGDVVIIPAGVGHKNLGSSPDLLVIGAYPPGPHCDLCRGQADERPQVLHNIAQVPLPGTDPIYGDQGLLFKYWGD